MIEGRIIIPRDVFVTVCVEVQKLSDLMLKAAICMQNEVNRLSEESQVLNNLLLANVQLGLIHGILKAIVSDDEDEVPPAPVGNGGEVHA